LKQGPQTRLISLVAKRKNPSGLTLLGKSESRLPSSPADARLETFPNPAKRNYRIRFETADFTSLCPVTGQIDFAQITIEYVPAKLCVESKSLKFYLASYRNERAFNEAVTNRILDDFVGACSPREAVVTAEFSARGGIALTVRAEFPDAR
jgi:7-cyano-7-deazaguanine reductase